MNNKWIPLAAAGLCTALLFSGCGASSPSSTTASPSASPSGNGEQNAGEVETGQITEISGSSITIQLARSPADPEQAPPSGEPDPSDGAGSSTPPTAGSGTTAPSGQPSGSPGGQNPPGEMQFTGETISFTLSGDAEVVRLVGNGTAETEEAISAGDLQVGDVISVEWNGDSVVKVTLTSAPEEDGTPAPSPTLNT